MSEKMATGGRKCTCFGFDNKFKIEEEEEAFVTKLESIRDRLMPPGSAPLGNNALMYMLFELAENYGAAPKSSAQDRSVGSFLEHSDVFL